MSVTRNFIAQRLLAALGLSIPPPQDTLASEQISYSTLSRRGVSQLVVPHYEELNDRMECTLLQRGVNDTYLLSSGAQRFALKIYRLQWRSSDALREELASLKHLRARHVQVALPVTRRDGDLMTQIRTPEGLRSAVLFYWIRGSSPKYTEPAHSALVGRHLAQVHSAAENLSLGPSRPRIDMERIFERPSARIRAQAAHDPSLALRLDELIGRMAKRVSDARAELSDWGYCHGDVTHYNIRIEDDRVSSFDFDWCGPGWRIFDLATYVWAARYLGGMKDYSWQPLLDAYLEARPGTGNLVKLLPLFVLLRHFWHTEQCIALAPHLGTNNVVPEGFFESFAAFCESIEGELH